MAKKRPNPMTTRTIYEQYQIVTQIRAIVFEAYASATELMTPQKVVEKTGLFIEEVTARTEELLNEGRIWSCGRLRLEKGGEKVYTTNPNVAFASCVSIVEQELSVFKQLADAKLEHAQIDLLIAIREYVLHKNPNPQLLFDTDGNWMKLWKEVREIIDEEVLS